MQTKNIHQADKVIHSCRDGVEAPDGPWESGMCR